MIPRRKETTFKQLASNPLGVILVVGVLYGISNHSFFGGLFVSLSLFVGCSLLFGWWERKNKPGEIVVKIAGVVIGWVVVAVIFRILFRMLDGGGP